MVPSMLPGAAPAYWTVAGSPAMVAVTDRTCGAAAEATAPSVPAGEVCPPPVPNRLITLPAAAGALALFRRSIRIDRFRLPLTGSVRRDQARRRGRYCHSE